MVEYTFIDTSIILGYCNHFDHHYERSRYFLDGLNTTSARSVILLKSVEREFYKKIQKLQQLFISKLSVLRDNSIIMLEDIKNNWTFDGKNKNFEKYIFEKLEQLEIEEIEVDSILLIEMDFQDSIQGNYDELVKNWIKWPSINRSGNIEADPRYRSINTMLSRVSHPPDRDHLSFALYRAGGDPTHDYYFYTTDYAWENIDQLIGLRNFSIRILFLEKCYVGNKDMASYTLDLYQKLQNGDICLVLARGFYINKAVDTCLFLQANLLTTCRILKIKIGTESYQNRFLSTIEIVLIND